MFLLKKLKRWRCVLTVNTKRIQPIDSIETHSHGISKDLIWKKEKSKRANIIRKYKYI